MSRFTPRQMIRTMGATPLPAALIGTFLFSMVLLILPSGPVSGQATEADAEIAQITQHPAVRAAFDAIMELEPQTQADLITLTEIPAPPFAETERGLAFADMLRDSGADSVYIDEVGNVIGLRRGTDRSRVVALDAHLDTVFPIETDVSVQMRGDTLVAPGIGDDTRGLVVLLAVLRAMEAANLQTEADILFVGSVGEEGLGDLRGMKHLFRDGGPQIDAFIGVDGGSLGRVLNQGLGSHRFRATFNGPGGHSWSAFGLVNPAHAMGLAMQLFDDRAREFVSTGPRTSYNVGRIGGGTSINSIPFSVWMEVDMRSISPERLDGIDAIFRQAMEDAELQANANRSDGDPLVVDVEMIGNRPSGSIAEDTPLIQRSMAATRFLGGEPQLNIASTNANIPISMGIPAVGIGKGGSGGGGHSLDEWWVNEDGHIGIQKALLITITEAGLAGLVN